jgi:NAD(P)-dependent dehydrogenase (short-subunit alcohol dehydrogenase family)
VYTTIKIFPQAGDQLELIKLTEGNEGIIDFPWPKKVDLAGQVILAAGGLGNLSEIFLYAAASCGAQLVIVDHPPADHVRRDAFDRKAQQVAANVAHLGGGLEPVLIYASVTDHKDLAGVADHTLGTLGKIDVAVDFAGTHHPTFDIVRDDPAELASTFRSVIELNLTGAFLFTAAMARAMVPKRSGHIIHLCSSASRLSLYGSYAYNASKHGVEGIVKTAAAQLAPLGVRVNGIAPGTVVTDLNRNLSFTDDGRYRPRAKSILAHTPTKRFLEREGIAETLISMCVPQRHLTGNVIFADDGYNVEGHSWPDGNEALYAGPNALKALYDSLETTYPRG